ncbi:MAG TPA: nitroreductase family protein [Jatrophihabitans sp.]|nr:nitroreductase family protein [Jatrophihabitans sp.]
MSMPTLQTPEVRNSLRHAAIRATLAPSVHNTQPWLWRHSDSRLELCADRSRQLRVLDPTGRQLLISCGCALFNARVHLAADGFEAVVRRFPDPADPDELAVIEATRAAGPSELRALNPLLEQRQTNRRQFADDAVAPEVVDELVAAAAAEDCEVFVIQQESHRIATAVLSQKADQAENANPAYRAELRAWTSDDPSRRDGVPAAAVPHVDADAEDDIPIRDFDTRGSGWLPTKTRSSLQQCLLLLCVPEDSELAWLRAGEALERIWLEATRHGYAMSLFTQVIEVPHTREALRAELGLVSHPVVLIRVGRAPKTASSHRRRIEDVLVELA